SAVLRVALTAQRLRRNASMLTQNIGFVGAGQMARALAGGFVRAGLVADHQILACDPSAAAKEAFLKHLPGAGFLPSSAEVARASDVLFLATKPQHLPAVRAELRPQVSAKQLIVSIAAGIRLAQLA